ncbi:LysR family transcriptional regulator [Streptomyces sp. MMS24-I2-30]|uniref:LysR family transcriptional regulator n=1 Tax=Streptomyces sp. MMS24-I2-30 TaxID=3351564 RepID=UPI003896A97E
MDVDTRLLRSFVAVAETGSLTRAAERLFLSQPALTKQIKQLEGRLGLRLFTRSRSGMALTEPGRALAERAPALLADWDRLLRETKGTAARAARVLRVGFLASAANEATQRIVAEFGRRRPGWRADMRQAAWSNPTAGLADGDSDVALLRLPFPGQEALRVAVLFSEPRWIALPAGHRFAARDRIAFRDLWDEPFVAAPPESGAWRDYWLAAGEREGHPVRVGSVTDLPDDWLSAIANGYGIALAPESAARYYARPGIVYRPVSGVSPSRVGVAWAPADDTNPVVQDFVRSCLTAGSPQAGTGTQAGTETGTGTQAEPEPEPEPEPEVEPGAKPEPGAKAKPEPGA